ncbi:MAG: ATP-binding protein, partial [Massilia sp.]
HRLVQVLANLLNNAAKYTSHGGCVEVTVAREPETVAITVHDNGVGIDASLLPRMFDLFTQAERSPDRAQGGLGIGLALVRSIIDLHGGDVIAASDGIGRGSTFTVRLAIADTVAGAVDATDALRLQQR